MFNFFASEEVRTFRIWSLPTLTIKMTAALCETWVPACCRRSPSTWWTTGQQRPTSLVVVAVSSKPDSSSSAAIESWAKMARERTRRLINSSNRKGVSNGSPGTVISSGCGFLSVASFPFPRRCFTLCSQHREYHAFLSFLVLLPLVADDDIQQLSRGPARVGCH